jgi:hypothetical protein
MKDLKDLGKLTIYEIFENAMGKEKADQFFKEIGTGIKGKKGAALKKYIYSVLCKLQVTNIEIFEISEILIHLIPKQVQPSQK